jgi:hypothetical protein
LGVRRFFPGLESRIEGNIWAKEKSYINIEGSALTAYSVDNKVNFLFVEGRKTQAVSALP